ncbi:MAG: hypothetical protein JWO17_394 [Actinomycetia bacterium]|nr:hypothetical protein [Actinomycetes bacterium]
MPQSGRVELWTTNVVGGDARRLTVVTPPPGRAFLAARLTRLGDVIYAVSEAADGNVDDLYLVDRRTRRSRFLFSVRGLATFATSSDGLRIAYSRELPIAGKPATFVADIDGSHRRQVAPVAASYSLAWPVSDTLFLVGGEGRCWFCALSVATGYRRSVPVPVKNIDGWPVVSPRADRVAIDALTGPAGERIYTTSGKSLRNIIGAGGSEAFWAPDEQQLLIQHPGLRVFDFATHRLATFRHAGPASMQVLDWKSTNAGN